MRELLQYASRRPRTTPNTPPPWLWALLIVAIAPLVAAIGFAIFDYHFRSRF
jgi:hypothetical protein